MTKKLVSSRRELVRRGVFALTIGLPGCATRNSDTRRNMNATSDGPRQYTDGTDTPSADTTTAGTPVSRRDSWCPEYDPARPRSSASGIQPASYPSYPQSLTAETAKKFAREHEEAVRLNNAAEAPRNGVDEGYAEAGVSSVFSTTNTYTIRIGGTLRTSDVYGPTDETKAPSFMREFAAWYKLKPMAALRAPASSADSGLHREKTLTPPDLKWNEIVCNSS